MPGDSVKVAVRVRPFNQREKDRQAKLIIQMIDQMTIIKNPNNKSDEKKFTFDYSYWSHDGYVQQENGILEPSANSKYAGQRKVFEELGQDLLGNAYEGYNCSLFAYGQTGSGKSYSMIGYGTNRGIIPILCRELFNTIATNRDSTKRYEVSFSMIEIYNEQVRDLLSKENLKGGLQVRQNPQLGMFYVEKLKKVPVGSYEEIQKRMDQGTAHRTVASTNMNATSSRAHTVVTITFNQICRKEGSETKKTSEMNLVDLAGSERADSTGATGDRLKEGANINKSLSTLGNVISALADLSSGKKIVVPYRDSVLTRLLQNALGGNSKTVMIAAVSPADINYDESLSTLRYADRAKQIKNKAVINEDPIDKMIRELREENERLKNFMDKNPTDQTGSAQETEQLRKQMEDIQAQLHANQQLLADSAQSWEEKLAAARLESNSVQSQGDKARLKEPHLVNLNEDLMLSGIIYHFIEVGETIVGRVADPPPQICLSGLSIQQKHAVIYNVEGTIRIESVGNNTKTKVNGLRLLDSRTLKHMDRILFGSNHLYIFINPLKQETGSSLPKEITWNFAQKEIARATGYGAALGEGLTNDQQITQEQVLEILPMVSEVNAISDELDKCKLFEVVLISPNLLDALYGDHKRTIVMVKMKNLLNGNTWMWERGQFMNRRYLIQEMYQKYLEGENMKTITNEQDPFWEPVDEVLIGTANIYLQSLLYNLDFDDNIVVADYKGHEEGTINVNVLPCLADGSTLSGDTFVDDPTELLGSPFHFKVTIKDVKVLKERFNKGLKVKYKTQFEEDYTETQMITGSLNLKFDHSKVFSFSVLTRKHLLFFESNCITFLLYGMQEDIRPDPSLVGLTTRELKQLEKARNEMNKQSDVTKLPDPMADHSQLKMDLALLQKKYERLAQKERRIQQICQEWSEKPKNEQLFDPFWRSVSTAAKSTGTKFRTRVKILNKIKLNPEEPTDEETISLYVFGEEEKAFAEEAKTSGGIIHYSKLDGHYFPNLPKIGEHPSLTEGYLNCQKVNCNTMEAANSKGQDDTEQSSTCTLH